MTWLILKVFGAEDFGPDVAVLKITKDTVERVKSQVDTAAQIRALDNAPDQVRWYDENLHWLEWNVEDWVGWSVEIIEQMEKDWFALVDSLPRELTVHCGRLNTHPPLVTPVIEIFCGPDGLDIRWSCDEYKTAFVGISDIEVEDIVEHGIEALSTQEVFDLLALKEGRYPTAHIDLLKQALVVLIEDGAVALQGEKYVRV